MFYSQFIFHIEIVFSKFTEVISYQTDDIKQAQDRDNWKELRKTYFSSDRDWFKDDDVYDPLYENILIKYFFYFYNDST